MLFRGVNEVRETNPKTDVQCSAVPLACFEFDRPPLVVDELQRGGAMAFATAFGFSGMSLLEWSKIRRLASTHAPEGFELELLGAEATEDNLAFRWARITK
jgi:hypothetical protein